MNIRLEESWKKLLEREFEQLYFQNLIAEVKRAYATTRVYPQGKFIFRALDLCPVQRVKVVILGQDPYHGEGQAEGLSFSVPKGVAVPPSLRNMKKEILDDTGEPSIIKDGHLLPWVEQGVLLLNSMLTVRAGAAGSHQGIGWESFTDAIIRELNNHCEGIVFLLWGNYAKRKGAMIDRQKHCVLEAGHPSPLSVRHFLGCRHFTKTNDALVRFGKTPIRW